MTHTENQPTSVLGGTVHGGHTLTLFTAGGLFHGIEDEVGKRELAITTKNFLIDAVIETQLVAASHTCH